MIPVTLGPEGTNAQEAARQKYPTSNPLLVGTVPGVFEAFERGSGDIALVPVYNTIDGHKEESYRCMVRLREGLYWVDNVVLPIHHKLGSLDHETPLTELWSKDTAFSQCAEYIQKHFPGIDTIPVSSTARAAEDVKRKGLKHVGVIAREDAIVPRGLVLRERGDLVENNRTRFAVFGRKRGEPTGFDATSLLIKPSPVADQNPGWLTYTSSQFSDRGVNLLDINRFNDPPSRSMFFYIECEGHVRDREEIMEAIEAIRNPGSERVSPSYVKLLGSYPRVVLEERFIRTIGFIGTGKMSQWYKDWLESEGYDVLLTGRTSELRPEEMIEKADAVFVCVPISAAEETLRRYGPNLRPGQLLVDLTGEKTRTMGTALECTHEGVEVLGVHNLWGPKTKNIAHKNVVVVKGREGRKSREMETLFKKYWTTMSRDTPERHDLYVAAEQKLPHAVAIAMARVLKNHHITPEDMESHATLTSVYTHLQMARLHAQSPRTYAEIQASNREGSRLIEDLIRELRKVKELGDKGDLEALGNYIEENRAHLEEDGFLDRCMELSSDVNELLSRKGM